MASTPGPQPENVGFNSHQRYQFMKYLINLFKAIGLVFGVITILILAANFGDYLGGVLFRISSPEVRHFFLKYGPLAPLTIVSIAGLFCLFNSLSTKHGR